LLEKQNTASKAKKQNH